MWTCQQKEGLFVRTAPISKGMNAPLRVEDLRYLVDELPETTHLRLDDELNEADLAILSKLKRLRSLAASSLELTDEGARILNSMPALQLVTVPMLQQRSSISIGKGIQIRAGTIEPEPGIPAAESPD